MSKQAQSQAPLIEIGIAAMLLGLCPASVGKLVERKKLHVDGRRGCIRLFSVERIDALRRLRVTRRRHPGPKTILEKMQALVAPPAWPECGVSRKAGAK